MAWWRKRKWWLSGYVADHALDWDQRVQRWRVEVRWERGRIMWSWPPTPEGADHQRQVVEGWMRPNTRY